MAGSEPGIALGDLHEETRIGHALFRDGFFQEAVRSVAERYSNRLAEIVQRTEARDRRNRSLIERVFSEHHPILTFPTFAVRATSDGGEDVHPLSTREGRDEHNGYRFLGVGMTMAVRNVFTHADTYRISELEAFEWLAFISAMHRRLDLAELDFSSVTGETESTD